MIDHLTTTLLITGIAYSLALITVTAVLTVQYGKWRKR